MHHRPILALLLVVLAGCATGCVEKEAPLPPPQALACAERWHARAMELEDAGSRPAPAVDPKEAAALEEQRTRAADEANRRSEMLWRQSLAKVLPQASADELFSWAWGRAAQKHGSGRSMLPAERDLLLTNYFVGRVSHDGLLPTLREASADDLKRSGDAFARLESPELTALWRCALSALPEEIPDAPRARGRALARWTGSSIDWLERALAAEVERPHRRAVFDAYFRAHPQEFELPDAPR
jgi:hypothetical protein